MKVVILCGGQGTRLREETEFRPKPMVTVGNIPILTHIMNIYSHYGHNDFILALGYKGDLIKEYYLHYKWHTTDFTLNTKSRELTFHEDNINKDDVEWNITFADTGSDSLTATRLVKLKKYLENDDMFMLTYGDGVSDIDINKLIDFHKKHKKLVTLTGISPNSQFGIIDVDDNNIVKEFKEKPKSNDIINGGFMVFSKEIFDHLDKNENVMLVGKTIPKLAKQGQVAIYHHKSFWYCMDTYRDYMNLNKMWDSGNTPWKKD